jgi:hypothetical protein
MTRWTTIFLAMALSTAACAGPSAGLRGASVEVVRGPLEEVRPGCVRPAYGEARCGLDLVLRDGLWVELDTGAPPDLTVPGGYLMIGAPPSHLMVGR